MANKYGSGRLVSVQYSAHLMKVLKIKITTRFHVFLLVNSFGFVCVDSMAVLDCLALALRAFIGAGVVL